MRTCLLIFFALCGSLCFAQIKTAHINGAAIHYSDTGSGDAIIFIHGALDDMDMWEPLVAAMPPGKYRFIRYSRRFNYPNKNAKAVKNFSTETEARDLEAFVNQLKLPRVHLVGHSFGAQVALAYTRSNPTKVSSLTISEPPLFDWIEDKAEGRKLVEEIQRDLFEPVTRAFEINDTLAVMKLTLKYFGFEGELSADIKNGLSKNMREWRTIFTDSIDPFPNIFPKELKSVTCPVFVAGGLNSPPIFRMINQEIMTVFPKCRKMTVPDAAHDIWTDQPEKLAEALDEFLSKK